LSRPDLRKAKHVASAAGLSKRLGLHDQT